MIERRVVEIAPAEAGERPASLAVHVAGHGPLAVLIHGFPLDHRMWLDVLQGPLAQRRTVCALDLRGHGGSPWCGDAVHTMERFADDVAAVIRSIGDGQADIVGLSMGGYVALALWTRHAELVRSLVLSNTRASADDEAQRAAREAGITLAVTEGRGAIVAAMLPKLLAPDAGPLVRGRLRTMIEDQAVETIVADQRGMQQRADRLGMLATITVPTLVVAGQHDLLMPLADAEAMQRGVPGARLEVVAGTAHMTPLEAPERWSRLVADHLRDGDVRASVGSPPPD